MKVLSKIEKSFLFGLFLAFSLSSRAEQTLGAHQFESGLQGKENIPLRIYEKFNVDFYSEVYSSPLTETSNQFQRVRAFYNENEAFAPFLGIENYTSEGSQNTTLELGLKVAKQNWQYVAGIRKEKLNESNLAFWNLRLGIIYSKYWSLPFENAFADAYAESFANQFEGERAALSLAAWAKVGYRYYQQNGLFFDPLILGVRGFENSNRHLLGSDYKMFQAGLQGGCYFENPMISSTIILTKSWSQSQAAQVVNSYWLLWSLEVKF